MQRRKHTGKRNVRDAGPRAPPAKRQAVLSTSGGGPVVQARRPATGVTHIRDASAALKKQLTKRRTQAAQVYHVSGGVKVAFAYHRTLKCFQLNGQRMSGLCRPLHEILLPALWSVKRMTANLRTGSSRTPSTAAAAAVASVASAADKLAKQGQKTLQMGWTADPMARGRRVHAALDKWHKSGKPVPHTGYVRSIVDALAAIGLVIIETEAPCWWSQVRMCTRADIVCQDVRGMLWIIELKTSQSTLAALAKAQVALNAPFHRLPGSILTVWNLQALGTQLLFQKCRPTAKVAGCAVLLLLKGDTPNVLHVKPEVYAVQRDLETAFAHHRAT